MRTLGAGHALFAATLIAVGLGGLATGALGAIWQPAPKSWPFRDVLAYACAAGSLACGAGLIWRRTGAAAAGVLTAWLLVWLVVIKGRFVVAAPLAAVSWESAGETAVLVAAAWVLFVRLAEAAATPRLPGPIAGETGLRLARTLYGAALVAFGVAHLAYVAQTAALVPRWLPAPAAWVYATGLSYIAAGAAIVGNVAARLAAFLAALQIGLFTLLVWAPLVASGRAGADDWSEAVVSWSLTAAAWVMFDSYRGAPLRLARAQA
jgi:uncharacterized membrane protein